MPVSPGQFLQAVRERLKLDAQQVQDASMVIAAEEGNENFYVPPASLTQIESDEAIPNFYKLYSLCAIYGLYINDLLSMYGVPSLERRLRLRRTEHRPNERGRDLDLLIRSTVEALKGMPTIAAIPVFADMQRQCSVPASNGPKSKPLLDRIISTLSFWKAIVALELRRVLGGTWRRTSPGS